MILLVYLIKLIFLYLKLPPFNYFVALCFTDLNIGLSMIAQRGFGVDHLEQGSSDECPQAILIYARGTPHVNNVGIWVGPILSHRFEKLLDGGIWTQGVGGPYLAISEGDEAPRGAPEDAIAEGVRLFVLAREKCPNTPIAAAGWSQGSALIAAAISDLTPANQDQVKGVTLFDYTMNEQNDGLIPGYYADRIKVFCTPGVELSESELYLMPSFYNCDAAARCGGAKFLASSIQGGPLGSFQELCLI